MNPLLCMEREYWKKMKSRCAVPHKKLKELESILQEAISLDDETESSQRRLLLCDEIDQRSFFLHSLLKAEISSCPSPPSEKGHLIHIQLCFQRLHHAYHEWAENFNDPTLLEYLGSDRSGPECTASCFNADKEEEEEEEEDIGELTESIISSTQMSENTMEKEEELYEDVVLAPVKVESVGVQTENLGYDINDEKSCFSEEDDIGEMTETLLWNENPPVAEEFYEDEGGVEAEEEEEEEESEESESEMVLLDHPDQTTTEKRERVVVRCAAGRREKVGLMAKKGIVMLIMMGSSMMMGFMIGRFYQYSHNPGAVSNCSFDYYYDYSMGSVVVGGGGRHHVFNMLPT